MQQHAASFIAHTEASTGAELPRFVRDEFEAFLECGILAHGFLRLRSGECSHDKLLAFSCKRRGFCPSCGARRMSQTAAHLVDHVIPHVPVRQWVLSLPIPLRVLLAAQPELVTPVLQVVQRVVAMSNALAPDLVALTGDIVDGTVACLAQGAAPLADLVAKEGVFLVLGKHDYYLGAGPWVERFEALGLQVLRNESRLVRRGSARLVVGGVTDPAAHLDVPRHLPQPALAAGPAAGTAVRLLLAHHPKPAPMTAGAGFAPAEVVVLAATHSSVLTLAANALRTSDGCADAASSLQCLPSRICCGPAMYLTDLTHFLDKSGAIGPVKGPARAMAQFNVDAVAHASDSTSETLPAPKCIKCKKGVVEAVLAQDNAVVWVCPNCRIEGRISNWQGSLWDLRSRPPTSG